MPTPQQRYRVLLTGSAEQEVAALDRPTRRRIQTVLLNLAQDPDPPGVTTLAGQPPLHRIRVGTHRVIYTERHQERLILTVDQPPPARHPEAGH
jgi:mRNA interferase RelE/StbE